MTLQKASLLESFLKGEVRVLVYTGLVTLLGMTVLFIAPVFVAGDARFGELAEMSIVTRVVLPMRAWLVMFIVGTVVNALVQITRKNS